MAYLNHSIIYHVMILETFRPFISQSGDRVSINADMATESPHVIFAASVQQLKAIVIDCNGQQQHANATIFWAGVGLMQLANAVLRDLSNSDWRYFFLYCIRSFQSLYPAFAVCKGIVQGLLMIAVQESAITSTEARLILDEFRSMGDFHKAIVHNKGAFVVDLDLAVRDQQHAKVEVLVEKFELMSIFSDFTEGVL